MVAFICLYVIPNRSFYPFSPQVSTYYDILQALILSPSCPKVVLALTGASILSVCNLNEPKRTPMAASFNISAIRQAVSEAIISTGGNGMFLARSTVFLRANPPWGLSPSRFHNSQERSIVERKRAADAPGDVQHGPPSEVTIPRRQTLSLHGSTP